MRLRFWLPLIQTLAMLLITWAPWAPESHRLHVVLRDGREFKAWTLVPGPNVVDPLDYAQGINLPAAAVVVPAEFAARGSQGGISLRFRFFGFWIVGLLCWYLVGRCADDVLDWRRSGILPGKHGGDLAFAFLAVPSSLLLAGAFLIDREAPLVLAAWSVIWLALSLSALAFRLLQVIRQRQKFPAS